MPKKKSKIKAYSRKKCPKGYISRRSFTTKRSTKKSGRKHSYKVKASCIKSPKSRRGRGLKIKRNIPSLRKGTLRKFGYSIKGSETSRKKSLRKASKSLGKTVVIRKLNIVRTLTKNTQPGNSRKYGKDLKFVQRL